MSEPYLTTREALNRIETDVAALRADVHKIQIDMAKSSATVVSKAADAVTSRAQAAIWVAAGSGLAALAAVIVAIVKH